MAQNKAKVEVDVAFNSHGTIKIDGQEVERACAVTLRAAVQEVAKCTIELHAPCTWTGEADIAAITRDWPEALELAVLRHLLVKHSSEVTGVDDDSPRHLIPGPNDPSTTKR